LRHPTSPTEYPDRLSNPFGHVDPEGGSAPDRRLTQCIDDRLARRLNQLFGAYADFADFDASAAELPVELRR